MHVTIFALENARDGEGDIPVELLFHADGAVTLAFGLRTGLANNIADKDF
jgi:hypothetical protein